MLPLLSLLAVACYFAAGVCFNEAHRQRGLPPTGREAMFLILAILLLAVGLCAHVASLNHY